MSDYYRDFNTVEDFILDDSFVNLSKRNNQDEITELFSLYPDKKDVMKDAIVLLQCLEIHTPDITDAQIDKDWDVILERINEKKYLKRNKRFYIWTAGVVAACAAIIFLIFLNPLPNSNTEEHLFSLMESADIQDGEVQIIAGNNQTNIDNDETIIQTEEGGLLVGKEQKMESSSIKAEYLTVIVPKGRRTTVKLSDGSAIWVNSGTRIVYPKVFSEKSREIVIDGEAYMDVAKDESRPFIVHTKGFSVQVIGTQFNISAYSNDSENSVVLVEGAVEVTAGSSKGKLLPRQGFFTGNGASSIRNVDIYPYVCWKDGVMQLNGESLDVIMKRLSRYYGLDIRCSERFALEKYEGKIDLKKPIETVLNNLSVSTFMSYTRDGDIIYVR